MALTAAVQFENPMVLFHSIDAGMPELPSSLRVYLCGDQDELVESWMDCGGVILLHASTYTERLLKIQDHIAQTAPDAAVVVLLNYPDMRTDRLLEAGVQEVITHDTDVVSAIKTAKLRKERECVLQTFVSFDVLTQLANRQLFQDRLEHSLEQHKRQRKELALLVFDIDRFFRINEEYGHAVGDSLLLQVSDRLKTATRKADTLARIGGNTFAIVAENLQAANNVSIIAEKICGLFHEAFDLNGEEIHLSVSLGAALSKQSEYDPNKMIHDAEQAMQEAKQMGRNSYVLYKALRPEDRIRGSLERALYQALANDQIFMEYQPQVTMDGKHITGVEALMRWNHPIFGSVPPDQFIPVLETTGLIESFGMWGLTAACAQFKEWLDSGIVSSDARVSVNLSPRQFHQPNLAEQILNALDETGLPAKNLTLEITESMVMENQKEAAETLAQLRFEGIAIAVDDFGTGYSSMAYLKVLPVDYLKIDREFVKDIVVDSSDKAIASSIIHLAHSLQLGVVAEGVEGAAIQSMLQELGCDQFQGYHFARPVGAADIPAVCEGCV